jgi:thiamine pyrophosphokinase
MQNCVIFCAGEFHGLIEPVAGLCIAADGGLAHLRTLGLDPDVILGDFDSLGYVPQKANVFPVEKDDTDAMLAVRHGLKLGCDRFVLYGALEGPRLDHTVANFQTLLFLADHGATGYLVGKDTVVTVLKNGSLTLPALPQGIVSVFCLGEAARGVTLRGLQYELEKGTLTAGFPLGVSNHFIGKDARISVKDGSLLIMYPREAGLI